MREVYIVSAVRTPIGKFGGTLSGLTAADLGVLTATAALARARVPGDSVDEVLIGQARQAGNGPNPARQVGYRSGIPETVPATTINKACGSGLKSVMLGANEIAAGRADINGKGPAAGRDARWASARARWDNGGRPQAEAGRCADGDKARNRDAEWVGIRDGEWAATRDGNPDQGRGRNGAVKRKEFSKNLKLTK